jgi:hypothetical protein
MTPDLQRLCQAAEEAFERVFNGDAEITPGGSETIVRAVLMALKEPSNAVKRAAEEGTEFYGCGENISYNAGETIARAVDHILGEDHAPIATTVTIVPLGAA